MKSSTLDKISCFLAELIGTAMLVFLGCMGCVNGVGYDNNVLQMSFNFGLVVMVIIQCFGCVSGAHLNPTVTLAALVYKLISAPMAAVYFVGQMVGGFIGYGLLKAVIPEAAVKGSNAAHGLCVTTPMAAINNFQATAIEFLLTSMLIFVCCGVWDPRNAKNTDSTAIRFGLTISCLAITGGAFTGASMNPARSFAPALWNNDFESHWVYWLGPLFGAAISSVLYKAVFRREVEQENTSPKLRAMEEIPLS